MFNKKNAKIAEQSSYNIFTSGVYHGRADGIFGRDVTEVEFDEMVKAINERANTDGNWCIDNKLVGDNENKMRAMMLFVANVDNIRACVNYIFENDFGRDVDFVCRDLANASKGAC